MVTRFDERLAFELSRAEALVLFDWLASREPRPADAPAEQQVLWRVEGELERRLAEVLAPNYKELVAAARHHVAGEDNRDRT